MGRPEGLEGLRITCFRLVTEPGATAVRDRSYFMARVTLGGVSLQVSDRAGSWMVDDGSFATREVRPAIAAELQKRAHKEKRRLRDARAKAPV